MAKLVDVSEQIKMALGEYEYEFFKLKEDALDESADYLVREFGKNAPKCEKKNHVHKLATSFLRTDNYKNVRYCGSNYLNNNSIPVANLLEFGRKSYPFMRTTFDNSVPTIAEIIKNKLNEE